MPLYESLTGLSTPDQVAAAYNEYVNQAGGDTQANQGAAAAYLQSLGLETPTITQAYDQYRQSVAPVGALEQVAAAAPSSAEGLTQPQDVGIATQPVAPIGASPSPLSQAAPTEAAATGALPTTTPGSDKFDVVKAPGSEIFDYDGNSVGFNPDTIKYIDKATGKELTERDYRVGIGQGTAADTLASQILGQGTAGKWNGQGFGSADANAQDMAKILAGVGITDLSQFGLVDSVSESTQQVYQDYAFDDQTDSMRPAGRYYTLVGDGEKQYVDPSTVSTDNSGDSASYVTTIQTPTKTYGNTVTGQALPNTYGERQTGNAFGGTYAGEGNTGYRVDMSTGKPIFYTTGASSNSLLGLLQENPLLSAAANAAAAYFGGPLGTAALQAAQGKDIEDIAKSAALTYVGGQVAQGVSGSNGVVDALGKTGANIAGRVAGSVVTGGGTEGAIASLISGGVNAAMPEIQSMVPGFPGLSPAQQAFVNKAITNTLKDGKLSPADLVDAAIFSGKVALKDVGGKAPVVDISPTSFGTNITGPLADAGTSDDVNLPSGIQTASTESGLPSMVEISGAPIFADSRGAANIRPPTGYTLASSDDAAIGEPARYDDSDRLLPKSDGTYYDITQNAWFKPSGEFDLPSVTDYSSLFGGDQANLTGADLSSIRGNDVGSGAGTNLTHDDISDLVGNATPNSGSPSNQDILDAIGYVPDGDAGTIEITDKRPVADDAGEIEIVGDRIPPDDAGVIEIVGGRPVVDDAGEIEIVADRPVVDDAGKIVVADTRPPADPPVIPPVVKPTTVKPPVVKPPTVVPPKTTVASKPSSFEASITTTPQFLRGAPGQKAMKLAALRQLYDTLTPEMKEIFAERGITMPENDGEEKSKKEKNDEKKNLENLVENLSAIFDPQSVTTKFAASGGTISELQGMKDTFNPNLKTVQSMLGAAPIDPKEPPLKLAGLRHLREGVAKPPRAMGGLAQGGLPKKYADAAPEGHNPEFITGLTGYYATGKGTGQSDDIPAMLHDGDYVIDADAVAALGDGSSKAGALALSQLQSKVPHEMSAGGQAVAAKIADGEYVFPEAFVSALGGGDNKAGAKLLDAMREELRAHKRSAPTSKIPPKAKSPLDYLKMAKG